jgi:hypothetical protein
MTKSHATRTARRARNLDDAAIAAIVGILDGWTGPLSWEALIDRIETQLHSRYTRQALYKHERIRQAFSLRRTIGGEAIVSKRLGPASLERQRHLQRIDRLTAENQRLERENNQLLEQFARWLYNAHARGLDENFLNQPLPPLQREESGERQ